MSNEQQAPTDEPEIAPSGPVLHTDDVSSFLDLQTEFIKRRDAALSGRQTATTTAGSSSSNIVHKTKNNILAITKEEKRAKQEMSARRTQRIKEHEELIRKEEQQRARQQQMMAHKAAIYERMSRGEKLVYEDGREADFLVDFNTKKRELEQQSSSKARANANDDDSTDEELRRSDDERERRFEEPAPLIVHYDPSEEKGRVFGASHVPLPTMDEDAREKKIAELTKMTEETKRERAKRKKERDAKKATERARVNRLRERMGLPPVESSDEEEDAKEEAPESSTQNLDEIPLPKEKDGEPEEKKPKKQHVREWDRGKVGFGYTRWIAAQREERDEEFAPPSSYYSSSSSGKR